MMLLFIFIRMDYEVVLVELAKLRLLFPLSTHLYPIVSLYLILEINAVQCKCVVYTAFVYSQCVLCRCVLLCFTIHHLLILGGTISDFSSMCESRLLLINLWQMLVSTSILWSMYYCKGFVILQQSYWSRDKDKQVQQNARGTSYRIE